MFYSRRSRNSLSPSPYRRDSRLDSRSLSRSTSRSSSRDVENPGNNLESRGFGFVTMSTVEEADHCIKYLDRSVLEGHVITVEKAKWRRGRTPTPGRYLGLRTISATLLIGGAGVGHHVIHLNVTGIDRSPRITADADRVLQTSLDLSLHPVGLLSAGMTGPPRFITRGIINQMADTIEDTAIALYLAILLHVGLRGVQGEGIHAASPVAHGGGAIQEACPPHQGGGGAIHEASLIAQGGGAQEEAIHVAYRPHQGGGGAIHEASPVAQGGEAQEEAIHAVYPLNQGGVVLQDEGRA
ncbi:hypothetical protein SADUNF_Sadunf09G0031900 [Salix dunnii]|uniref:RRM domain-containing protein n=1 Tax=Salix dunnii TaxID=1413687 RepID=A0A835JS21_9ROSI|nr:hypothetical protein SADUNF_Sadunf09G0031900 [Salix dunnii]